MRNALAVSLMIATALIAGCENTGSQSIELGAVEPPEDILAPYGAPGPPSQPMEGLYGPPAPAEPVAIELVAPPAPAYSPPPPPASVYAPAPAPAAQRIHVVRSGETLWRISGMYYGKASRENVAKIVQANPALVNPDVINAGQKIVIPD